jgi:hypothetical protein
MRRAIERAVERAINTGDRLSAWGTRLLRGRGIRRAWLVVGCLVAVPMLAMGAVQAASTIAHEEHTEVAEIDAADLDGLVVDNDAGTVTIIGVDDATTVTVRARISEGLRATGHQISERDGLLFVEGSCPLFGSEWCGVDYTVEVPADLSVDVRSLEAVSVSDVSGGLVPHSTAAAVELARVGGDVTVSANQGRLEATDLTAERVHASANQGRLSLEFADSPDEIVAEANQGSVEIVLPDDEDVFYATVAEANQGAVNDRIRRDPDSGRSITVEANQGSITITYATQ